MQVLLGLGGSPSEEKCGCGCLLYGGSRLSAHILLMEQVLRNVLLFFPGSPFSNELLFSQFVPVCIFWGFWLDVFLFRAFILVLKKVHFWTLVDHFVLFLLSFCLSVKFLLQNFDRFVLFWHVFFLLFRIFRDFFSAVSLAIMVDELFLMIDYQQNIVQ